MPFCGKREIVSESVKIGHGAVKRLPNAVALMTDCKEPAAQRYSHWAGPKSMIFAVLLAHPKSTGSPSL